MRVISVSFQKRRGAHLLPQLRPGRLDDARVVHAASQVVLAFALVSAGAASEAEAQTSAASRPKTQLEWLLESHLLDAGENLRTDALRTQTGSGVGLRVNRQLVARWRFGFDAGLVLSTLGGVSDRLLGDPIDRVSRRQPDLSVGDASARGWLSFPTYRDLSAEVALGATRRAVERRESGGLVDRVAVHPAVGLALRLPAKGIWPSVAVGAEHLFDASYNVLDSLGAAGPARALRGSGAKYFARISIPLDRRFDAKAEDVRSSGDLRSASARSVELTLENDLIWTDRAYTNGVRLQLHESVGLYGIVSALGAKLPECAKYTVADSTSVVTCIRTSAAVQQTMYTPTDQYADTVQRFDRPFAGLLYGSARWEVMRREFFDKGQKASWGDGDFIVGLEAQLGVIGPTAQARETQRMAHWAIATTAERPSGWRFQTPGRPYVQALADLWYRPSATTGAVLRDSCGSGKFCDLLVPLDGADVALHAGMAVGSVFHRASLGVSGRWAHNRHRLPGSPLFRAIGPVIQVRLAEADTLNSPLVRGGPRDTFEPGQPTAQRPPVDAKEARPRVRYALIATAMLRATARNETITGGHSAPVLPAAGVPVSDSDLRLRSGYAEAAFGGEIEVARARLGFQSIWRGSEFSRRSGGFAAPGNRYFTLSVAYLPR